MNTEIVVIVLVNAAWMGLVCYLSFRWENVYIKIEQRAAELPTKDKVPMFTPFFYEDIDTQDTLGRLGYEMVKCEGCFDPLCPGWKPVKNKADEGRGSDD